MFSWWTGGGEAAGLTKVIAIWNKENPSIKFINAAVAGGAGTNAKAVLAQRLSANDPPDSFQGHAGAELQDYIKAGDLEPLDFLYRQAGFGKFFPQSLVSQIRYQGKLYSVPVNIHRANVLWYNPRVLREAGINAGQLKTWAQFVAALKKADDAGVIPLAVGEQWTNKHLFETVLLATLGPAQVRRALEGQRQLDERRREDGGHQVQRAARPTRTATLHRSRGRTRRSSSSTARPRSTSWATGRTGTSPS